MNDIVFFIFALFISSSVSGATGLGGGIILLAFMTPLFPPAVLIPLHGIIQLMSNMFRSALSFKKIDYRIFIMYSLGAALGSAAGMPVRQKITADFATALIAVFILLFTWMPKPEKKIRIKGQFFIVGSVASFLSLFIGATGPLTAPFFLNSKLEKTGFVATKSACQVPIHFFKVIVFLLSGFTFHEYYLYVLTAVPVVAASSYFGKIIAERADERIYRIIIRVIITVLAVRMIYKMF